jgi:CBS domain-containing protein
MVLANGSIGVERREARMNTIRQILQLKGDIVWTIAPDQTVYDALRLMADKDIGTLAVIQNEQLIGLLSERDYARKVILLGKASRDTLVSEIMTSPVHTIHPDQTVEEAMEKMTRFRVRYLPVLEDDRLLGIISIGDVVRDIIYRQRETIKAMSGRIRE